MRVDLIAENNDQPNKERVVYLGQHSWVEKTTFAAFDLTT